MPTFLSEFILNPWPWYIAGPLIGLFAPALLLIGNRVFGVSSNLRHICSAVIQSRAEHFQYDWQKAGLWNLLFIIGVFIGGFLTAHCITPLNVEISEATRLSLSTLGIRDFTGLVPAEVFSWPSLLTLRGAVSIIVGGFFVGFGSAYAGGCTSGHAISGLSDFQLPSLLAVCGFFAGGCIATFLILPFVYA